MISKGNMNKNIIAIKKLAHLGKYQDAARIADDIRWGRVKDIKLLNMVSDIYEKCERYHDAKRIMMIVYNRVDVNKRLVYKMCELSARAGDLADAEEFYWEYSNIAPKDTGKLILAYHIMCAAKESDKKKIEVLELYIKEDFDEKWAYKLAQLYYKMGQTEQCIRICDEIILWYSGDYYGAAALALKHKCLGVEDDAVHYRNKTEAYEKADIAKETASDDDEAVYIKKQDINAVSDENQNEPILQSEPEDCDKDISASGFEADKETELSEETDMADGPDAFNENIYSEGFIEQTDSIEELSEYDIELSGEESEDNIQNFAEEVLELSGEESEDNIQNFAEEVLELSEEEGEDNIQNFAEEVLEDTEAAGVSAYQKAATEAGEMYEKIEESADEAEVREKSGIILEKQTEHEKVFVFNQELFHRCSEDTEADALKAARMPQKDICRISEAEKFITAEDDKEDIIEELLTEEVLAEEDIAAGDSRTVVREQSINASADVNEEPKEEKIIAADVKVLKAVREEVYEIKADTEEVLPISAARGEEAADEKNVCNKTEEVLADEEEYGSKEAVFTEAAITAENVERITEPKVRLVGYIDNEHNFTLTGNKTESDSEEEKIIAERPAAEKNEGKAGFRGNNALRILLIECSQMKGSVKYTANKLNYIHQQEGTKLHGIAKISDDKFSVRGALSAISVLKGRDLIVEGVDGITYEVVNELQNLMDKNMKPIILALVDTPTKLALFVNRHRTFAGQCEYIYEEASVSRREFLNYINNYAYKLSAVLDDMAEEELEYIADEMIEDGIAFTISEAATLVERAIEKAQKPGIKGLFEAKKDFDGYLILRARHFDRG